jgi:hypothetical protein
VVDVHVVHAGIVQAIGEPAGVVALGEAADLQRDLVAAIEVAGGAWQRPRPVPDPRRQSALRPVARPDRLELDARGAGAVHAQAHRGGVAQVHHPSVVEGSAVVDPHDQLNAVVEVGHAHVAGQRQGLVRGGELADVVELAAGRWRAR